MPTIFRRNWVLILPGLLFRAGLIIILRLTTTPNLGLR